jgi:hypothetical protein
MADSAVHSSFPRGIAVRLTLVGISGEPADDAVADQAADPVVASHRSPPGQQAVCGGAVATALAVHGEGDEVKCAAAKPELIQSTTPVIRAPSVRTFDRFRSLWA